MGYLGRSLRRRGVQERPVLRVAFALALSLVLNALGGWLLILSGAFSMGKPAAQTRVALAPIDSKDWEANRAIQGEVPSRKPPDEVAAGPVVELPTKPEGEAPDEARRDARHSAERNQKVERETVSRYAGVYPKYAPKPQVVVPGKKEAGERGQSASAKSGSEGKRGDRLALAPSPFGERSRGGGGEDGRRARGKLAPDLTVGSETAEKVLAGPGFEGYREGLDAGEETALNTATFKYATFFNRFKQELGQEFIPRMREATNARDPDLTMFFYKDRTVVLDIALGPDGRVKDLSVLQPSGVDFYDRTAVESLRAAQPYANLPHGMLGDDGEARFTFAITLFAGDPRPRLRWRRAP